MQKIKTINMKRLTLFVFVMLFAGLAKAEDGHQLWLRYQPVNKAQVTGPACLAAEELARYSKQNMVLQFDAALQDDEYRIDPSTGSGTVITAKNEIGLLYQQHMQDGAILIIN